MNREIKFRVWNPDDKRMEFPLVFAICSNGKLQPLIKCSDGNRAYKDYPIMQFTGLKDKNGKEIYEGDILSLKKEASLFKRCPIIVIGSVNFVGGKFEVNTINCINLNVNKKGSVHFGMKVRDWIHLPEFYKSEVIGNIFENPELLQE